MKVSFSGLDLPEGKVKFNDEILNELERKFSPKKVSPYFFEFVKDDFEKAEAIAIAKDKLLDLLIQDIEKLENRLCRATETLEQDLIKKCISHLELEQPLCDMKFSEEELPLMRTLAPLSYKPTYVSENKTPDVNELIKKVMEKAEVQFFYTAGKPEVRPWFVKKGSDIVTCAGKIHTDLAKGFIKADILNMRDYAGLHNLQEARAKGVVKLVDRDYIIQEGDIIEIRFNV